MMADKNEFLRQVEDQLSEMKDSHKALQKKMENTTGAEKQDLAKKMAALEKRYSFGVERMQELAETSEHVWDGLQDELEIFWTELTTSK